MVDILFDAVDLLLQHSLANVPKELLLELLLIVLPTRLQVS